MSIEDKILYAIVNKTTGEAWGYDTYSSPTGCKTSWFHASKYYCRKSNRYKTIKFDEQDKYKIVKVKLVIVGE
jgi:type I restriction-modification system DNA methylase subunit